MKRNMQRARGLGIRQVILFGILLATLAFLGYYIIEAVNGKAPALLWLFLGSAVACGLVLFLVPSAENLSGEHIGVPWLDTLNNKELPAEPSRPPGNSGEEEVLC